MPATNLQPFSTYLPPEVKAELEKVAASRYTSAAAIAREVLCLWHMNVTTSTRRRRPSSSS